MSPERSRIEVLARAVAEGDPIDWAVVLRSARTASERRAIEQLRIVEELAQQAESVRGGWLRLVSGSDPGLDSASEVPSEWSLVSEFGTGDISESKKALASLCRRYWYPVCAEIRRTEFDSVVARDRTRAFFAQLAQQHGLVSATPRREGFREFLKAHLADYLSSPVSEFDRRWARALLKQVLGRLREEMAREAGRDRFEQLSPLLTGSNRKGRYRELAHRWGMSEAEVQMAVRGMRGRFRSLLREEVARTLHHREEIGGEIHALLSALEA